MHAPHLRLLVLGALGSAALATASAADLITNGDFESGISGWTVASQVGTAFDPLVSPYATYAAAGSGYVPPSVGFPVLDPYAGAQYALGDATAAGAYVLLQDFSVPVGTYSANLSFQSYIYDWSGQSTIGNGFDYTSALNQHVRVDILKAGSDDFSLDSQDLVASLFANGGNETEWSLSSYDVMPYLSAGQTYRLRFATVASNFVISHGIDDVHLDVQAVPEPATLAVLGVSALTLIRRRRAA